MGDAGGRTQRGLEVDHPPARPETGSPSTQRPLLRWSIPTIGGLLFAGLFARWHVLHGALLEDLVVSGRVIELAFTGTFTAVIVIIGAGLALGSFDLPADAHPRVAMRSLTGLLGFAAVITMYQLVHGAITVEGLTKTYLFGASLGAIGGLLYGMQEAYAVENAREVERKATKVQHVEAERARLEYLNNVLRHEVLNNVAVISGYADLAQQTDDTDRIDEHLETIRRHSDDVTTLIDDVRTLIDVLDPPDDATADRVDLGRLVTTEIERLRTAHPSVTVSIDAPDDVSVEGDHTLVYVFRNLLNNAVKHNDADDPRIDVTIDRTSDTAVTRIADNGPGIPEGRRDTLFERSGHGNHGLGLYTAATIVAHHDGGIDLADTRPDGSTFTVTLPRAPDTDTATSTASTSPPEPRPDGTTRMNPPDPSR